MVNGVWPPPLLRVRETYNTYRGATMQACCDRCMAFPRCKMWTAYGNGHNTPRQGQIEHTQRPPNATAETTEWGDRCFMFESVGGPAPVPGPPPPVPLRGKDIWARPYGSGHRRPGPTPDPPAEKYYLGGKLAPAAAVGRAVRAPRVGVWRSPQPRSRAARSSTPQSSHGWRCRHRGRPSCPRPVPPPMCARACFTQQRRAAGSGRAGTRPAPPAPRSTQTGRRSPCTPTARRGGGHPPMPG